MQPIQSTSNSQSSESFESSTMGMLRKALITIERCKKKKERKKLWIGFALCLFSRVDSMEWDAGSKHLPKMALVTFISCSQCIPFKIADSQKNFTGSLPQIYGFLDIVGYDNSKSDYNLFYSFNSTRVKNIPMRKALICDTVSFFKCFPTHNPLQLDPKSTNKN